MGAAQRATHRCRLLTGRHEAKHLRRDASHRMFTQCPQCHTIFRIYAEQLAQAQGRVRCGICDQSFNALENLSEYLDNFAASSSAALEEVEPVEHEHVDIAAHPSSEEPMAPEASFEPPPEASAYDRFSTSGLRGSNKEIVCHDTLLLKNPEFFEVIVSYPFLPLSEA